MAVNQNDLSFESLNPINNSFTSGQFDMQFNNFMQSVQHNNHKFKQIGPTKIDLVSKSERDLTTASSSIIKNPVGGGINS